MKHNPQHIPTVIIYTDNTLKQYAMRIADHLGSIAYDDHDHKISRSHPSYLELISDSQGDEPGYALEFVINELSPTLRHRIDFNSNQMNHRKAHGGGSNQELVRACGLKKNKNLKILDATAGLGTDAFVLACNSGGITMSEQNPVLGLMLQNALNMASKIQDLEDIISRMSFESGNSLQLLLTPDLNKRFDVVYLDPMYPIRKKNSAKVKKAMQVIQYLAHPYPNEDKQLLIAALDSGVKRVVVKRPSVAENLMKRKPHSTIESSNTRYDIYM